MTICAEEDGRCEYSLEAFDHSGVIPSIFREMEEAQHFGGAGKADGSGFLFHGQCCDPDGNQSILAEWQTEVWMRDEVEEEFAVAPAMYELRQRWAAQRESAQDKWPGIEREFLPAASALLADEADRLDLLQPPFR